MSGAVADNGAQPERTALSWRRTALALAIASLAIARGFLQWGLVPAVLLGLVGCLAAGLIASRGRRRHQHRGPFHGGWRHPPTCAQAALIASALVVGLCAIELALLLA